MWAKEQRSWWSYRRFVCDSNKEEYYNLNINISRTGPEHLLVSINTDISWYFTDPDLLIQCFLSHKMLIPSFY
jgi:hypothetical protein